MSDPTQALSLRAKVAQLVFPSVFGDGRDVDQAIKFVRAGVGGIVLYEGPSPRETAELTGRLRGAAEGGLELVISADQENGAGQVVTGATELPPAMAFAAAGSPELMREAACIAAREGASMGFDLNYAPVADFTAPDTGPVEGGRTFGTDLERARALFEAYVTGYHEGGMAVTAKHFPGRGSVKAGPEDPWWCWIDKSEERLDAEDFASFRHAIAAGVDFVMTEHIAVPSVSGDWLPASASRALVTGCLRERLGFAGVITSDDLWYDKVCERFGPEEVGVLALQAGHDVLLKPRDPLATIDHVVRAVEEGRIAAEQIDASFARLLAFKRRLASRPPVDPDQAEAVAGSAAHREVAQRVADASVTVLVNADGFLPIAPDYLAAAQSIVHLSVVRRSEDTMPAAMEAELRKALPGKSIAFFTLLTGEEPEIGLHGAILDEARDADIVIVSLSVARNRLGDPAPLGDTSAFIARLARRCDVIALSHGNPYVIPQLPGIAAGMSSWGEGGWFGNKLITVSSMVRVITGEFSPQGKLPVVVGDYPIGHGLVW